MLKIAIAGTIDTPINSSSSAGTEIWTYNFCQELVREGHKGVLFADASSKINGEVVSVCKKSEILESDGKISRSKLAIFSTDQIIKIYQKQNQFDLVHISIFSFPYVLPVLKLIKKPIFITFHGSGMSEDDAKMFFLKYPDPHYIFASKMSYNQWPHPKKSTIIYHGINIQNFPFSEKREDYYFWMGRISPEKGVEDAISFAKKSGQKLIIAGPVRDQLYFENSVKPHLSSKIKYVGVLGLREKVRYYQKAKAFIFSVKSPEPFGLVVAESLACGTPVIASDLGAAKEIIVNGENGYLVKPNSVSEIIKASTKVNKIRREACRKSVEEKYNIQKMVDSYVKYYNEILNK